MSSYHLKETNALIQDLIESLATAGCAHSNETINILSALIMNNLPLEYHNLFTDRIEAEADGDATGPNDYLYFIRPLIRHSVTVIQKIQVSVYATNNNHAIELAKYLDNPLKHGEVFETEYTDAFRQDT
jgi:hypothetical protein